MANSEEISSNDKKCKRNTVIMYGMSQTKKQAPMPIKRNRILVSCTECHRRKQKCNRLQPCNDCMLRNVPYKCMYQVPEKPQRTSLKGKRQTIFGHGASGEYRGSRGKSGVQVELSVESIGALATTYNLDVPLHDTATLRRDLWSRMYALQSSLRSGRSPGTIELRVGYYLPSIPKDRLGILGGLDPFHTTPEETPNKVNDPLIHYFLKRLAPWLSQYEEGLEANAVRVSWLPDAMTHPTLFRATLLAASVHLGRRQPELDARWAVWYKIETMRLMNEKFVVGDEGASDQLIISALILLYFNVGGENQQEYETHLRGIHQMIELRGGIQKLGLRGIVTNWLAICYGPWSEGWEYTQFD